MKFATKFKCGDFSNSHSCGCLSFYVNLNMCVTCALGSIDGNVLKKVCRATHDEGLRVNLKVKGT